MNFQPQVISPEHCQWEDQAPADSTTALLHTKDSSKVEGMACYSGTDINMNHSSDNPASHLYLTDVTYNFDLVVNTNSPESCWVYLKNLEKRGNPHTDTNLFNKLKDCYSKVFSRLPIRQFSKNASYAKILVRYAELRG